nr:site-specific integrase [uncultured Agathobaculum sp.]
MSEKRRDSRNRVLRTGESQRKDGRYLYKYVDADGKPQSVYSWKLVATDKVPAGKRDCIALRDKEQEIQRSLADGVSTAGGKLTVSELYTRFTTLRGNVKRSTKGSRQYTAKLIAEDLLGAKLISGVKPSDAQEWALRMQKKGLSYRVINNTRRSLKAAFQMAVSDGWLRKNPFDFALNTVIRNEVNVRPALTEEQEQVLLDFVRHDKAYGRYYNEILILLRTGLRIGEFCGLTVQDIDFENGLINIDHQLRWEKGGSGYYIDTPKSKSSIRKVPMSAEARKAFERVIARRGEPEPFTLDGYSGFLFVNEIGEPYPAHHYQEALRRMVQKYNRTHEEQLPKVSPHVLRHTFCTRLANKNMNPKSLQYIMGHADINITLNLYAHVSLDAVKAEVVKLLA